MIASTLVAWDWFRTRPPAHTPIEDDRENLRRLIAKQETDSARALADYQPKPSKPGLQLTAHTGRPHYLASCPVLCVTKSPGRTWQ